MLTRQEIFDKAWTGLKSQGFEHSVNGDECAYRGEGGRRCAIGWCIEDERYSVHLEGRSILNPNVGRAAQISEGDGSFAASLQDQHDYARDPSDMKKRLRTFAAKHSLAILA